MSSVFGHILFACLFLFQDGSRHLMLHQKLGAKRLEAATLQPNMGQFPIVVESVLKVVFGLFVYVCQVVGGLELPAPAKLFAVVCLSALRWGAAAGAN